MFVWDRIGKEQPQNVADPRQPAVSEIRVGRLEEWLVVAACETLWEPLRSDSSSHLHRRDGDEPFRSRERPKLLSVVADADDGAVVVVVDLLVEQLLESFFELIPLIFLLPLPFHGVFLFSCCVLRVESQEEGNKLALCLLDPHSHFHGRQARCRASRASRVMGPMISTAFSLRRDE